MFRCSGFLLQPRTVASALLLLSASLAPGTAARAQVVYSSLNGTFTNLEPVTNFNYVDDYTSTLFNPAAPAFPAPTFQVSSFSFVGGPTFTGLPTNENSALTFSFLDQFGGVVSSYSQNFATSGSFLRTVDVSAFNISAATKGFFQVSSSATTVATFEFTDAAPAVGSNDPNIGNFRNTPQPGVKAFSITAAQATAAPEPGTIALVAMGLMGTAGMVVRRKKA